jgi:hypothetical protein
MPKTKYSGVAIDAGDSPLIVPALSFRQLQDNAPLLDRTGDTNASPSERIAAKVEAIALALTRNYPEMTVAEAAEYLDLNNIGLAFEAALGASKENKTRGEA